MWRNVVSNYHRFGAPASNNRPLHHLFPSNLKIIRAKCSSLSTNNHREALNSEFCLPTYHHSTDCLCCQKRPQPSWKSSALYQQKRQFTSKLGDTIDGNTESTKLEDDNSNHAVTASEDVTADLVIPGAQKGGKKLAIIFTCTVCDTRSAKQFTENAYQRGVVIVTCPGCNNRHLIADNLSFFSDEEDGWNIEKGMAELGQNVNVVNNDNVLELSVEDIYGKESLEKALAEAENNSDDESQKS